MFVTCMCVNVVYDLADNCYPSFTTHIPYFIYFATGIITRYALTIKKRIILILCLHDGLIRLTPSITRRYIDGLYVCLLSCVHVRFHEKLKKGSCYMDY